MKKRVNPDSEANIRRIDSKPRASKQTHGFQVHFLRGTTAVTRMFSDTVYGGKEGARRAARKFKRTAMAELPDRVFRGRSGREEAKPAKKAAAKSTRGSAKSSGARSRKR
ncbi:MAG: hypothetical protein H0T11_07990 [Chthoniobacterales bacterium]|nr:hypothetical protein [Chthoniobacterales bacterium]